MNKTGWFVVMVLIAVLAGTVHARGTDRLGRHFLKAASLGDVKAVQRLIQDGVDIETRDREGLTALMHAASKGRQDIVETLLANGARVNAVDRTGRNALMMAALAGDIQGVRLLVESGADVNAMDYYGSRPLLAATSAGHAPVVEVLLAHGAYVDVRNYQGLSVRDHARALERPDLEGLILRDRTPVTRPAPQPLPEATPVTAAPETVRIRAVSSEVQTAQRLLRELGYAPGPIDGKVGPRTLRALKAFAAEEELAEPSPVTDPALMEAFIPALEEELMVRKAQRLLNDMGLNPGPIDGEAGLWTTQALSEFQRRHELPQSGLITPMVLEDLTRVQRTWKVQQDLHTLGFDPGPIDGKAGVRTARAIRAFEASEGLSLTGRISETLVVEIEREALVRQIQSLLLARGFDPGPIDGEPGARTLRAVRSFQKARHLEPTGAITGELLDYLKRI